MFYNIVLVRDSEWYARSYNELSYVRTVHSTSVNNLSASAADRVNFKLTRYQSCSNIIVLTGTFVMN